MTTTPLDYFDKVPGTIEQLVLGTITQKLINRDYLHESLRTDFTTNAITYSITADSGDSQSINGALDLSLTFPTVPFERQILVDNDSFDLRIMSINSLNADTLSLPQKPNYPIKSFPAQLPAYLDLDVPENILERRLIALCLHVRNYLNWIERWNRIATQWIFAKYSTHWNTNTNLVYPVYNTLSLAKIELLRDELLLELTNGVTYKPIPVLGVVASLPTAPVIVGNPNTAQAMVNYFLPDEISGADSDPGNQSTASPLSSTLLADLVEAARSNGSNNSFGSAPNDPQDSTPTEKPTLPNC